MFAICCFWAAAVADSGLLVESDFKMSVDRCCGADLMIQKRIAIRRIRRLEPLDDGYGDDWPPPAALVGRAFHTIGDTIVQ